MRSASFAPFLKIRLGALPFGEALELSPGSPPLHAAEAVPQVDGGAPFSGCRLLLTLCEPVWVQERKVAVRRSFFLPPDPKQPGRAVGEGWCPCAVPASPSPPGSALPVSLELLQACVRPQPSFPPARIWKSSVEGSRAAEKYL